MPVRSTARRRSLRARPPAEAAAVHQPLIFIRPLHEQPREPMLAVLPEPERRDRVHAPLELSRQQRPLERLLRLRKWVIGLEPAGTLHRGHGSLEPRALG